MEPLVVFVLQFFWFLFAWSLIVYFVVWPWSARFSPDTRLSAWVAPEMFRVLGVGLLVPNLSPVPHAAATGAISHLAAQWYVPVFAGPPLVICHVACFILLVRGRRSSFARELSSRS